MYSRASDSQRLSIAFSPNEKGHLQSVAPDIIVRWLITILVDAFTCFVLSGGRGGFDGGS